MLVMLCFTLTFNVYIILKKNSIQPLFCKKEMGFRKGGMLENNNNPIPLPISGQN